MLNKIINKLHFIRKLPRKMAEIILSAIIIFDELFWRFRIFAFTLIFGKKNRIGKALIDLKKTGFANTGLKTRFWRPGFRYQV